MCQRLCWCVKQARREQIGLVVGTPCVRLPGVHDAISIMMSLGGIGCTQTSDGAKYKGVLSKINADGLMLRIASLVFDGLDEVKFAKPEECKMIADSGWSKLEAVDVKVGAADVGPIGAMDDAGGFGTDSAISRGKGGYGFCFIIFS